VKGSDGIYMEEGSYATVDGELTVHTDEETYISDTLETDADSDKPHDSSSVQFHIKGNAKFTIEEHGDVTGVVYAPSSKKITAAEGSDLYGAVVGDKYLQGGNGGLDGGIHYDNDLSGLQIDASFSQVYFLHLTENKVEVE